MPRKDADNPNLSWYTDAEIIALLERARQQGYDLGPTSDLERLTIEQLERLLNAVN